MCALNAKATNAACKEHCDRLVAKGKNKKLAIIAHHEPICFTSGTGTTNKSTIYARQQYNLLLQLVQSVDANR